MDKLSVIIPARNESENLQSCIGGIVEVLKKNKISHEVLVIDDGSTDNTQEIITKVTSVNPSVRCIKNQCENGFGYAVRLGLQEFTGDAVAIMMADQSDSPNDLVKYWKCLRDGYDCAFGSRFIRGSRVLDYPLIKLIANRITNTMIRITFNIQSNDITNAFKMYRRNVIEGCKPLISPHFNLTVEIPLKAVIRGYSYKVLPISWKNRTHGETKLKLKEMGSRYFFIIAYLWLEKYFSRGDYINK
ncbi:glycosyltransferase family 2 protein [Opitutales bacterium]|nr:glycosyltransferase family 2 protein [Opitutales bacterium]